MKSILLIILAPFLVLTACNQQEGCQTLPVLGNKDIMDGDTIFHTIPDFVFVNQDSILITPETFKAGIYVADFFFISCPTICPKVKKEMLRIHDRFKTEPRFKLLSHTIDIKHDTIPRLKSFSKSMGVETTKWHFVTGDEEAIYGIADAYFSIAIKDGNAPGGFDHSGRIILVDSERKVRSFCDGTDPAAVDQFMLDIECLLNEEP
ncbi:MAG: SCO family protein [Saprospiraceae bacterium]|nr:SCO family protein [Saprospiraceae bacterium]